jgi:adenylate cyclase
MRAIALDPDYARAHANLALTYGQDVSFGWTSDQEESIRLALESIERAETLDDTIVQTHFARSTIHLIQKQYSDAESSIRRAIQLDPNYADGYGQLAITLLYAGKLPEALAAIEEAKRLNPRYPFVYLWIEGHAHFLLGRHEKAITIVREVLERNPAFEIARLTLISIYGHLGIEDEASWEVDELLTLRPDYSLSIALQEALHAREEDLNKFIDGLRRAGIPE